MEATKFHDFSEALLEQYEVSCGHIDGGIPAEIFQGASRIPEDRAAVLLPGPSNCTEGNDLEAGNDGATEEIENETQCAAALDGGFDEFGPLKQWDAIMKKYKIAQVSAAELKRLDAIKEKSLVEQLKQQQALAVAEAAQGIADLHQADVKKKLLEFANQQHNSSNEKLDIPYDEQFLRSADPTFWSSCFVRLFCRGDCAEKCFERPVPLAS